MLWLLLLSCAKDVPLSEIVVESADLNGISLFTAAVIGGGGGGAATLSVTEPNGRSHSFPVAIRDVKLGAVVEIDNSIDFGEDRALVLPEGERLTADQLLGRYRGASASVTIGAGVQLHNLKNRHDVEIDKAMFSVGVGLFAGWETMHLALGDRYGHEYTWEEFVVDDTGAPGDSWPDSAGGDSAGDDSGGPDDSAGDDSGGPDDSGAPDDSVPSGASGGRGRGCGSGPSELDDSAPSGGDDSGAGGSDDSGGGAEPPSGGGSGCGGGGCEGGSSSGGCSSTSGSADCVGCGTTGGGAPAPWAGLLALVLLRRRP